MADFLTLGGNNSTSDETDNKSSGSESSSVSDLGGYTGYTGYDGPSFSDYVGKGFGLEYDGASSKNSTQHGENKTFSAKSSAQYTREMEKLAKERAEADRERQDRADKLAEEKAIEEHKARADKEHRDRARRAALEASKDEENGVLNTVSKIGRGTANAISKAADVLKGEGDDAIKFGTYVSPEKRGMYNEMMKGAKESAAGNAMDGFKKYGPVGLTFAMPGGSIGMLNGLGKAIQENKKSKNEVTENIEENIRKQRQDFNNEYFDKLKKSHRR